MTKFGMGDAKVVSIAFEPRSTLGMEEVGDQAGMYETWWMCRI